MLYAIRNGGFSSGPMPQDIVVGEDAEEVADFIAKYSGSEAPTRRRPRADGGPGDAASLAAARDGLASAAVLDLKAIRDDPAPVRAALARRRDGSDARLDRVLELDVRRRELLPEAEGLKAQQNAASQAIARGQEGGRGRVGGDRRDAGGRRAAASALREELDGVQAELDAALASLPNPPDPTAADEDTVLRERGEAGPDRARTTSSSPAR